MNLVELIVQKRRDYDYNGYKFNSLQRAMYDMFADAIEDKRMLLVPSPSLPRRIGKTVVLRKLSAEYDIPIVQGSKILFYDKEGNERTIRSRDLRGTFSKEKCVLIDEPTSHLQATQKGCFDYVCIGYKNFEIKQPFRSFVDIAMIESEVEQLRREGKLYEHHRENQDTRNTGVYQRELIAVWGWDTNRES